MKKIKLFFIIIFFIQLSLFAEDNFYLNFNNEQLSEYKILIKPVSVDSSKIYNNLKLIQVLHKNEIVAEYQTLKIPIENLGEGYNSVEILNDGFKVVQTFRDERYIVISTLVIRYENKKFLLKEYIENVSDVYSDIQDFEIAKISLEKGIPLDFISDDLIYIFHSSMMLSNFTFIYKN